MVYKKHIKIVWRGYFFGTPEEWSFSTKWRSDYDLANDADINNIDASAMRNALLTYVNTTGIFSTRVRCSGWRAYAIGPDGKMVGNPRIEEYALSDEIGGNGTHNNPPQIALVVGTIADNRGPARFGRFYLPGPSAEVGADLRLSTAARDSALTATVAFLNSVQGSIDVPDTTVAATMVHSSPVGTGVEQEVQRIRIGRVYDTQRRRRTQLDEDYAEADVPWT